MVHSTPLPNISLSVKPCGYREEATAGVNGQRLRVHRTLEPSYIAKCSVLLDNSQILEKDHPELWRKVVGLSRVHPKERRTPHVLHQLFKDSDCCPSFEV